jgi:hypothetical protein
MSAPSITRSLSSLSLLAAIALAGCGDPEAEGRRAAQERAALETRRETATKAAEKIIPPVANRAKISCEQLIDTVQFTELLAEVDPLTVRDTTASDAEATVGCSLVRGGERPDQAQQAALSKKNGGRIGTIPGDEVCNVTAYCWTIEDINSVKAACKRDGFLDDDSLGHYACRQVVATGSDDVNVFKFFDEDTKCLLKVRGGPSMVDNDLISRCAKAARDTIGKPQIAPGWTPPAAGSGSDGAAAGSGGM